MVHGNVARYKIPYTLNSTYNEVAFNKKLAIMKENLGTKYTPFTYKYDFKLSHILNMTLNEGKSEHFMTVN